MLSADKSLGGLATNQGRDAQLFGQQLSSRLSGPTTWLVMENSNLEHLKGAVA